MILTPENIMKKYFPEPLETTRALYERLELNESGYSYANWLKDAEEHCLSRFSNDTDYKLLPDLEKNYWISPKVFWTLVQSSPSKICDMIRADLMELSRKVATDPAFVRQLADQLDQEHGIETVTPKVSKKLRAQYNQSGKDALEFSVKADTRLHLDIISGFNFQPGQKIEHVSCFLKLEAEDGVPYHIVDITLLLTNNHTLFYRELWSPGSQRERYGAILRNGVIRINLFQENNKLFDSYDYMFSPAELKTLELELEKVIVMLMDLDPNKVDFDQLGEQVLSRYNRNEQAYALAINTVIPDMRKYGDQENAAEAEAAFIDAVNQYWEHYVSQADRTCGCSGDLEQMVKDRIPRVTLALLAGNLLYHDDLCNSYFKRSYSNKQKQALLRDGNLQFIYALSKADHFDPTASSDQRVEAMCAFIGEHLDLMQKVLAEMGQWPSR
jgi:hypothetical protein